MCISPPFPSLQSGELNSPSRLEYLVKLIKAVREETIKMDMEAQGLGSRVGEGRGISNILWR